MLQQVPESHEETVRVKERRTIVWSFGRFLAAHSPATIVLLLLAAVAYFGHHHDWKLPKFSEIGNSAELGDELAWCAEHGVPEAQCVECRPELLPKPKDFGWCKEHGVSQCPLCHPEVAQVKKTPTVSSADLDRAARGLKIRSRAENNPKCTLYRRRLQFASLDAVKKAGIDVELVENAAIDEVITANGEITYDQTRVAHLPAKSAGSIWRVEKKIGDRVSAGDVLALIDAAEVGQRKAELLEALAKWELALATKERLSPLSDKMAIASSRILETEAALREARSRMLGAQQRLVNLGLPIDADKFRGQSADDIAAELQFVGLPDSLANQFDPKATTSNLLPIRAPFDGVIVELDAVVDEVVDTTKTLVTVVDTSQMWLTLDVTSEDVDYIQPGQQVHFREGRNRTIVSGHIDWISTDIDEFTRTAKVRAMVQNAEGHLRDATFGTGDIVLRSESDAIIVPAESLQWDGSCHVVFVRDKNFFTSEESPKLFYPRPVRVGARTDENVEILAGVLPGEVVVTEGSGVLRGELLKNNLGAG